MNEFMDRESDVCDCPSCVTGREQLKAAMDRYDLEHPTLAVAVPLTRRDFIDQYTAAALASSIATSSRQTDTVEIEVDGDTYARLAAVADAAETTPGSIVEQLIAADVAAAACVIETREDRLRAALLGLLSAFPELGRSFSTAEQQTALRRAAAALKEQS